MDFVYFLLLLTASGVFALYPNISVSKLMAFAFLSYVYTEKHEPIEERPEDIPEKKEIPYHDKYKIEFRKLNVVEKDDIDRLETCYVIEYTPIGNVIMKYDKKRESFVYYSDHVVPFRFLEVVSRKYALTFHCKSLVVDSEKEMEKMKKKADEEKLEKEKNEKELKDNALVSSAGQPPTKPEGGKKDVFAKFKTYNKSGSGPAPANPKQKTDTKERPTELVVDTNRYSKDGPFASFFFLQKPKKEHINEHANMTFAQFKRMQQEKKLDIV